MQVQLQCEGAISLTIGTAVLVQLPKACWAGAIECGVAGETQVAAAAIVAAAAVPATCVRAHTHR